MRKLLPPSLAMLLLLVAVPLGLLVPVVGPSSAPWRIAGAVPVLAGLALTQSAHRLFAAIGTEIGTFDDPTRLVVTGPYTYTRNPMYLGMLVGLAGVAVLVGSLTAWLAPIGFLVAADRWYIPIEEANMGAVFGAQYDAYRGRVGRWFSLVRFARQLAR